MLLKERRYRSFVFGGADAVIVVVMVFLGAAVVLKKSAGAVFRRGFGGRRTRDPDREAFGVFRGSFGDDIVVDVVGAWSAAGAGGRA